jgi:glycosyltransferase involved in cell wall biosynthesis
MRAVKGIDDLLNGVAMLIDEIPSLRLLLIGSIKDDDIKRAIDRFPARERLHLTGFRDDATRLAGLADLTVMASKNREGFPKSVIEAMAQGIPAVVTSVGGMPELVGHGEAGVLVEPCNPASIASGIRALYRDPDRRKRLGDAGQRRISNVFNVDQTIERTFSIFNELCP